jgi:hypothetical protein
VPNSQPTVVSFTVDASALDGKTPEELADVIAALLLGIIQGITADQITVVVTVTSTKRDESGPVGVEVTFHPNTTSAGGAVVPTVAADSLAALLAQPNNTEVWGSFSPFLVNSTVHVDYNSSVPGKDDPIDFDELEKYLNATIASEPFPSSSDSDSGSDSESGSHDHSSSHDHSGSHSQSKPGKDSNSNEDVQPSSVASPVANLFAILTIAIATATH